MTDILKPEVRVKCLGGVYFSIPLTILNSIYAKRFFVECNRCSSYHQLDQLEIVKK